MRGWRSSSRRRKVRALRRAAISSARRARRGGRTRASAAASQPRNGAPQRPPTGGKNTPYVVVSRQLASSPVHRGHRTAVPRREALILQAALNYPWLLHDHLEELACSSSTMPTPSGSKAR